MLKHCKFKIEINKTKIATDLFKTFVQEKVFKEDFFISSKLTREKSFQQILTF